MDALSPPMPLNGESKELDVALSRLVADVERARRGSEQAELRGRVRSMVRELRAREAIVKRDVGIELSREEDVS